MFGESELFTGLGNESIQNGIRCVDISTSIPRTIFDGGVFANRDERLSNQSVSAKVYQSHQGSAEARNGTALVLRCYFKLLASSLDGLFVTGCNAAIHPDARSGRYLGVFGQFKENGLDNVFLTAADTSKGNGLDCFFRTRKMKFAQDDTTIDGGRLNEIATELSQAPEFFL